MKLERVCVSLALISAAACGGGGSSDKGPAVDPQGLLTKIEETTKSAKPGGVWPAALNADLPTLDPNQTTSGSALAPYGYSRLFLYRPAPYPELPKGEVDPDVAESSEQAPDGLTVTVKLRPDVKLDPRPPTSSRVMNSADVKFSFDRFAALSGDSFDNSAGFQFPLPEGLTLSGQPHLLAAQAFIPPTERNEVAGFEFVGDNDAIRAEVIHRLNNTAAYRKLFAKSFPAVKAGEPITYEMFARAIAEFEFTLTFANAPVDRYARGELDAMIPLASLDEDARRLREEQQQRREHPRGCLGRSVARADDRARAQIRKGRGPGGLDDHGVSGEQRRAEFVAH